MRGRNPSADSAAGMAGGGSSRLRDKPFWPESDKSQGFGGGAPNSNECCEATSWNLPCILLELGGRHIAQGGVEPLLVIDPLDEFADARLGLDQVTIFGSVNLLILKRLHKALGLGIVVGISAPAHADDHAVLLQQIDVSAAGILHAAIGMMHQTWRRL